MIPTERELRVFLPLPIKKSGKHLVCTCFNCNKQLHYYHNIITGLGDCKKCGITANIFKFLKGWNKLELIQGAQVVYEEKIKTLGATPVAVEEDLDVPDAKLPAGFKPVTWKDTNIYARYLKGRKYQEVDFDLYKPGYSRLIDKYENYIIIPIYRDFAIKGFVARNILDDDRPRYQNKKGTKFSALLDGFDELTANTTTVILVEGHFDKVSVTAGLKLHESDNAKCLATFGKKLSEIQIKLLRRTNVKNIYMFYDTRDAVADIKACGLRAAKFFNVKGCYTFTGRDPGAMPPAEIAEALNLAQPISQFALNKVQIGKIK